MKNSYDSLNDTFNTDPVESTEIVKEQKRKEQIQKLTDDVSKDYDYTRGNLYSLIEKRSRSNQRYYGSCRSINKICCRYHR